MKKNLFSIAFFALISTIFILPSAASAQDKIELWPGLAPGETVREPIDENPPGEANGVTTPQLWIYRPEKQTTDVALILCPGGGFNNCYYAGEGIDNATFWLDRGYVVAVLIYRVPRPENAPIYQSALQDFRRAVRYMKANAEKYGVDPEKIGSQGFSAGGCLTLIAATNSETEVYEPVDELDKLSAKLAFAIPIYPAFVLDDGATAENVNRGEGAKMLPDFHFDAQTPPTCLVHGDADVFSPLGSIAVYKKMRQIGVPCELHVYSGAPHGFRNWVDKPNAQDWRERCAAWLKSVGF